MPDKRFCFDFPRRLTQFHDLVGRWVNKADRPDAAQVYEWHTARATNEEGLAHWKTAGAPIRTRSITGELHAKGLKHAQEILTKYEDVHTSTFTPESFVQHMGQAIEFGIVRDLRLVKIAPTLSGELEFLVILKKL